MGTVRAKKHLGQHFLKDIGIAKRIVESSILGKELPLLEIGPGTGVLTQFIIEKENFVAFDVDTESVEYLKTQYPDFQDKIQLTDFLKSDISTIFPGKFAIVGNFPYNISSQILFKVLENRNQVEEVVCMLQKEVAERIAAPPGSKTYGILSAYLQAFYTIEYLFTVSESVFQPPPKVKSGVIRLTRNKVTKLDCDEKLFYRVIKTAFNQRRKTLRNSLKVMLTPQEAPLPEIFQNRPEQLSVSDFVFLTQFISNQIE